MQAEALERIRQMVNVNGEWAEFRFYRPDAASVFLVGDFNDWQDSQLAMTKRSDGDWVAKVRLPAGEFKFRYCADGQWFTDYAAFGVQPGRFGMDSIVKVVRQPFRVVQRVLATQAAVA
jgi:1,4-alpha-glucan branching enzyme